MQDFTGNTHMDSVTQWNWDEKCPDYIGPDCAHVFTGQTRISLHYTLHCV